MTEFFELTKEPSWKFIINLNKDLHPLFKFVSAENLAMLLFCFKLIVDENEELSNRHKAKQRIYAFIDVFLPNEGLS